VTRSRGALEALTGAKRSNPRWPENDGIGAPVDYVFDLAGETWALEHTIIEAFDRQIHTGVDFGAFVTPIQDALDRHLPSPGTYHLTFPIDPCAGLKPRDIPKIQAAIIAWVTAMAAELHAECPEAPTKASRPRGHANVRKGKIEGLAFELHLHRETGWWMPEIAKGRLFAMRYAPANYEELRKRRIESALNKKLPKLASWKAGGASSVLVLENGDIALTNHVAVADAVQEMLTGRADKPDEIWLVDTTIETEWTVWRLMSGDEWFPDEETPVRYREFNPAELTAV
jgi:hypothetical protein